MQLNVKEIGRSSAEDEITTRGCWRRFEISYPLSSREIERRAKVQNPQETQRTKLIQWGRSIGRLAIVCT